MDLAALHFHGWQHWETHINTSAKHSGQTMSRKVLRARRVRETHKVRNIKTFSGRGRFGDLVVFF